ncbi:uncharacterized protein SPSK_10801 [Sporothrix schenckii 1099-18]|uniref:Uncharacterized protein n=1 Tax=Sporothrix schenckii 1099-18 TaxID=1397361 RepID=A0A0F2MG10_SPOSC|nr:uncharacterized protein SPSK_10801 [Sporothrix schenckii 1099-18]KJR88638.1 hypothetical protein SPSK_10801 [Sporothrix schenckii 1099-18]
MFKIPALPPPRPAAQQTRLTAATATDNPQRTDRRQTITPPDLPAMVKMSITSEFRNLRKYYPQRPEAVGEAMRLTRRLVLMKPAQYNSSLDFFCHFEQLVRQQDRTGFPLEDYVKCELLLRGIAIVCGSAKLGSALMEEMKTKFRAKSQRQWLQPDKHDIPASQRATLATVLPWHGKK